MIILALRSSLQYQSYNRDGREKMVSVPRGGRRFLGSGCISLGYEKRSFPGCGGLYLEAFDVPGLGLWSY